MRPVLSAAMEAMDDARRTRCASALLSVAAVPTTRPCASTPSRWPKNRSAAQMHASAPRYSAAMYRCTAPSGGPPEVPLCASRLAAKRADAAGPPHAAETMRTVSATPCITPWSSADACRASMLSSAGNTMVPENMTGNASNTTTPTVGVLGASPMPACAAASIPAPSIAARSSPMRGMISWLASDIMVPSSTKKTPFCGGPQSYAVCA
mmetsp:Transcript_176315/g.428956  ORF Transcript_176315/g.428956 Transcript_176315/m.428956 type:complete len:209 (-) Transcript_176315:862-1488(-)